MASAVTDRPVRGTRPRNRRALILAAASDLFARRGYDRVGMGELADAVSIGPSALYRHFSSKQHLLREVITEGLAPLRNLVDDLDLTDQSRALGRFSTLALDERPLGVLWQREARHLAADDRARLRVEVRTAGQRFTERVLDARPELSTHAADVIAWSTLAVLLSPSFHHLDLPRPAYDELLASLAATVVETPLPRDFPAPAAGAPEPALTPPLRREALLNQAVRMFAAHGYTGVGIEEIGAAVGMAGPSIYHHFSSKLDMLVTLFRRGTAVLLMDMSSTYRTATDATDALRRSVSSYVRFSQAHHDLIGLLITETAHLPEDEQHLARQAQHDYIGDWVHLLRAVYPELGSTAARIRVHAALAVANDAARAPHLRSNPAVPDALELICARLLGI